jgi:hypothetical protein
MNTGSASPDQQIENLKQQWDLVSDPDRARAIAQIRRSGLSKREIARRLQCCSEAAVRRLLSTLDAPAADLAAARQGSISTNELARRAKAAVERREKERSEARQFRNKRKAIKRAKLIVKWPREQNIPDSYDEDIIEAARDKFKRAWQLGAPLPKINTPAGLKAADDVDLSKPKRPIPENAEFVNWYADWLKW